MEEQATAPAAASAAPGRVVSSLEVAPHSASDSSWPEGQWSLPSHQRDGLMQASMSGHRCKHSKSVSFPLMLVGTWSCWRRADL